MPLEAPDYNEFMKRLGSDGSEQSTRQVFLDMVDFTINLSEICDILKQAFIKHNLETC